MLRRCTYSICLFRFFLFRSTIFQCNIDDIYIQSGKHFTTLFANIASIKQRNILSYVSFNSFYLHTNLYHVPIVRPSIIVFVSSMLEPMIGQFDPLFFSFVLVIHRRSMMTYIKQRLAIVRSFPYSFTLLISYSQRPVCLISIDEST